MQHVVAIGKRRLAVHAAGRFGDDRLVRGAAQGPAAALAPEAALARAFTRLLVPAIGLLPLRGRQAGIVRRLGWLAQLRPQRGNLALHGFQPIEQRQDQRVLLGFGQATEVGAREHGKLESSRP